MNYRLATRRLVTAAVAATAFGLLLPALAAGHAELSPAVSVTGQLQVYSLAVPTEKPGLTTTRIALTVPSGFGIDSFAPPPPGWRQRLQRTGSGESAVVTHVTWTGGRTPTGQDSLFQFLAQPSSDQTYTFQVQQTYSDGSIVNWDGPESSDAPAPTVQAVASLGGGGTTTLSIVALIVGALGLLAGGFALVGGARGRFLA
jgi:periplasmic copper chaperone A